MKYELHAEPELDALPANGACPAEEEEPLSVDDLLALDLAKPRMIIESMLPLPGVTLFVGAPKSGKTVLGVQMALAIAGGRSLFDIYRVLEQGPTMAVLQDDPASRESMQATLLASPWRVHGIPFHFFHKAPFVFGLELIEWLERHIAKRAIRMLILDSYTVLRGARSPKGDIVKQEQYDLTLLDGLSKRTGTAIGLVHHGSKGAKALDWSDQASGTFAMTAATESQVHITRFRDLDSTAPERLVRVRSRHSEGVELVIRFRKEYLDYEHVLQGGAAPLYPLVQQLRTAFGQQSFSPKDVCTQTGASRATVHRNLEQLCRGGGLARRGRGEYALVQ